MQNLSSPPRSDLFVVACEPSGDLLGFLLLQEFFSLGAPYKVAGVCGREMRKLPIENILDAESLSVMGFIDVARSFIQLSRHFFHVKREILKKNPKVVLLIDAPSFNLKLAKALKKAGYQGKIIQYVCPTIWAWKKHRKKTMLEVLDLLVPLFPFEKTLFQGTSLKTHFFGHPLSKITAPYLRKEHPAYITLFPGSRKSVIEKNLPLQLKTAKALSQEFHLPIQVVSAHEAASSLIRPFIEDSIHLVPYEERYLAMQNTRLALATSGTVTLELALCKVPTIVNYVIRPFDEWLATKIFKINLRFYCIVNLLLQKEIFPEFYGSKLIPSKYLSQAKEILLQENNLPGIMRGCDDVSALLNSTQSKDSFSEVLLSLLKVPSS